MTNGRYENRLYVPLIQQFPVLSKTDIYYEEYEWLTTLWGVSRRGLYEQMFAGLCVLYEQMFAGLCGLYEQMFAGLCGLYEQMFAGLCGLYEQMFAG